MEDLFQYGNVFCYVSSWKTKSSVKKKTSNQMMENFHLRKTLKKSLKKPTNQTRERNSRMISIDYGNSMNENSSKSTSHAIDIWKIQDSMIFPIFARANLSKLTIMSINVQSSVYNLKLINEKKKPTPTLMKRCFKKKKKIWSSVQLSVNDLKIICSP